MIDLNYILENKEHVEELLKRKNYEIDLTPLVSMINEKRNLLKEVESNKAEQNKLSKSVPQVKKSGGDVTLIFNKVKELAAINKEKEIKLEELENKINEILFALPNLPDEDLLGGGKENNKPIYTFKNKPILHQKLQASYH